MNLCAWTHFNLRGFPNRSNVALTTAKPKNVTVNQKWIKDLTMKNLCTSVKHFGAVISRFAVEKSARQIEHTRPEASVTNLNLRQSEKLVNHLCSLSLCLTFIPYFHPFAVILSVYLQQRRNRRRKYRSYRSFWQFNFNAWLSVNLIIILSNHPINVFYIYNDRQVSSPLLHHLSSVRD